MLHIDHIQGANFSRITRQNEFGGEQFTARQIFSYQKDWDQSSCLSYCWTQRRRRSKIVLKHFRFPWTSWIHDTCTNYKWIMFITTMVTLIRKFGGHWKYRNKLSHIWDCVNNLDLNFDHSRATTVTRCVCWVWKVSLKITVHLLA
jgi:hypothetical protein